MTAGRPPGWYAGVAGSLAADAWCAEVVAALRSRGVEPVLLKGPVMAAWLYPGSPGVRDYGDVDLLIDPASRKAAGVVLSAAGFQEHRGAGLRRLNPAHAETWYRPSDAAEIDLHTSLHRLEAVDRAELWRALAHHTVAADVGGERVTVLDDAGRCLVITLAVRPLPVPSPRSLADLERALAVASPDVWRVAFALAHELGASEAFAAGLRQVRAGAELADHLGMPAVEWAKTDEAEQRLLLVAIGRTPSWRRRLAAAADLAVPPTAYLRDRSRLARRGRLGLLAAYFLRIVTAAAIGVRLVASRRVQRT